MDEYRLSNPEGYELIEDYYLGEKVTHKELGKRHGIAESTAREKLNRNLHRLRKLAYKNLSFLEMSGMATDLAWAATSPVTPSPILYTPLRMLSASIPAAASIKR